MVQALTIDEIEAEFANNAAARTRAAVELSLTRLLTGYPDLNFSFGRGKIFWRVRPCGPSGFDNERELSYPKPDIARVNRLNDAGSPCLYLSTDPETAFSEIGATSGDHLHLAGFRVLADQQMRVAAIGEFSHVKKAGYVRVTGVDPDRTIARMINGYQPAHALRILLVDSYLASLLADPRAKEDEYLHTRTLADLIFKRSPLSVGMFYPSVRLHAGLNLALLPDAADKLVHGVVSAVVRINRALRFGYYDYEVVRTARGVGDSGQYLWQVPDHSHHLIVYRLTREEFEHGRAVGGTLLDLPAYQAASTRRRGGAGQAD
jgi:hypothetical protein